MRCKICSDQSLQYTNAARTAIDRDSREVASLDRVRAACARSTFLRRRSHRAGCGVYRFGVLGFVPALGDDCLGRSICRDRSCTLAGTRRALRGEARALCSQLVEASQ